VNGNWGQWSSWMKCSKDCGNGTKYRTRLCDSPSPKHGGKKCSGEHSQSEMCFIKSCELGKERRNYYAGCSELKS